MFLNNLLCEHKGLPYSEHDFVVVVDFVSLTTMLIVSNALVWYNVQVTLTKANEEAQQYVC